MQMDYSHISEADLVRQQQEITAEVNAISSELTAKAGELASIKRELARRAEERRIAAIPPVDRNARVLTTGEKESEVPDYREIDPSTGMQKRYVILSAEERAKGFVRPVRRTYRHKRRLCCNGHSNG